MASEQAPRGSGTALVLSGGAVLGAFQVGVLKALFQSGFQPSLIVGTSVGALNGGFLAFYPDMGGIARLERIWRSMRASKIFNRNPLQMVYNLWSRRKCLFGNDYLHELIHRQLPVDDFAQAKVPLYVVATNLSRGEKVVFHKGQVSDAVLASIAIPGLFCPVTIDGEVYMDGVGRRLLTQRSDGCGGFRPGLVAGDV